MKHVVIVGLVILASGCTKHAPVESREDRLSRQYEEALRAERERAATQERAEAEERAQFLRSDEYKLALLQAEENQAQVEKVRAVASCAQRHTIECAKRQLNDSEDPADHGTAIETLLRDCRLKVPTACLWLGDAYSLGRGVAQDHALARQAYEGGCNEYVGEKLTEWRADKALSCRRVANPGLVYEEPGLFPGVPAKERADRARSLADASDIDRAIWLAASVARSEQPDAPIAEGVALVTELAPLHWKKSVQPLIDKHHFVRAVSIVQVVAATEPQRLEVRELSRFAVEHHQKAAEKSSGSMAALHRAIAHRFDEKVALDAVPMAPAPDPLPAQLLLATMGTDCGFLRESPLPETGSKSGLPVRFKLACTTHEKKYPPDTVRIDYVETATRPAKKLETALVTTTETYPCGERPLYSETTMVIRTCTRKVTKTEKYLVDVMEEYDVPKSRFETSQERRLTLDVSGTVAFGTGPAVRFSFNEGTSDKSYGPGFSFIDVVAGQTQIRASARAALVAFLRREVAKRVPKPVTLNESASVTNLYLKKGTPEQIAWLEEKFGVTPDEMQRLLNGRRY